MGLLNSDQEMKGLLSIIRKHKINIIVSTPSFVQNLLDVNNKENSKAMLDKIITSGEFIPNPLKQLIERSFNAKVYSSYATSESFIGIECFQCNGFHFDRKNIIVEILDEKTNLPTNDSENIVITSLDSEAIPLIRYCLNDIGIVDYSKCSCRSSLPRVIWKGRTPETFVVAGGVNVYSYQIHNALSKSGVYVGRCEIDILDNGPGKDLVVFNIYTDGKNIKRSKTISKKISSLLNSMSIDFSDVICCKTVNTITKIKLDKNPRTSVKKSAIIINDKRKYAR